MALFCYLHVVPALNVAVQSARLNRREILVKNIKNKLALMASCPSDKAKQVVDGLYVEKSPFFTVTAQMDGVFSEPEAALL